MRQPLSLIIMITGVPTDSSLFYCTAAPPTIGHISAPADAMSHRHLLELGIRWPDAGLYATKSATARRFFVNSGRAQPLGASVQTISQASNSANPRGTGTVATATAVTIEGFPCPEGFPAPCLVKKMNPHLIWLSECKDGAAAQRWNISRNAAGWVSFSNAAGNGNTQCLHSAIDSVFNAPLGGPCRPSPDVSLHACGQLPTGEIPAGQCPSGSEYTAWRVKKDDVEGAVRIVSVLVDRGSTTTYDREQCLQVGPDNVTVILADCSSAADRGAVQPPLRELWELGEDDGTIRSMLGTKTKCMDGSLNPKANATNSGGGIGNPTIGQWVSNVYDAKEDGIILFLHLEFGMPPASPGAVLAGDANPYFRTGLAHSADGKTFQWCGYIINPAVSFEHVIHGSRYGRPNWPPNMVPTILCCIADCYDR
jgi:hypothetical protein